MDKAVDDFVSVIEGLTTKPANGNAKTADLGTEINEDTANTGTKPTNSANAEDDIINITEYLERIEPEYIAGKEVRGDWTREVLSIRANMYAFANATSDNYSEDTNKDEGREENKDEVNELKLLTGKDNEKEASVDKSEAIDRELSREKDPAKRKEIMKAYAKTKEFMDGLDKVAAERLEAAIKQNGFVMQLMLERELQQRGLMPGGMMQQHQKGRAAAIA